MPKWEIHNKWADKIGISKDIQNFVSGVIDFPEKCQEFQDFCEKEQDARIFKRGKSTKMTVAPFIKHDLGRNKENIRKIQIKFLSQKGKDYERAYYLHQILDYLKWWCLNYPKENLTTNDILNEKRLQKKIDDPNNKGLQLIVEFINQNSKEILKDCGKEII